MKIQRMVEGSAEGPVLACDEGLSFWGGVDPESGRIIDARHPQTGATLGGRVLMMPTSRGSSSGSAIIMDLIDNGHAPAALLFEHEETVITLGVLVAREMLGKSVPVLRCDREAYAALVNASALQITETKLRAGTLDIPIEAAGGHDMELSAEDRAMLDGRAGRAAALSMKVLLDVARLQGAKEMVGISRVHIDGCIYATPSHLKFAEAMRELGAKVTVPTTTNAISIDYTNWQGQGIARDFADAATRLADAYVTMGAQPTFTCAPYLLDRPPKSGEAVAWAESNAVVFANSVLGAVTNKHPDFLDLFMAVTGRAPCAGQYTKTGRHPYMRIDVEMPADPTDGFWPMIGWLIGRTAPDGVPHVTGLDGGTPDQDTLQALCAAFGTTSAAPMIALEGITPDLSVDEALDLPIRRLGPADFAEAWRVLAGNDDAVDLVALGSPHMSATACRRFAALLTSPAVVAAIITVGPAVMSELRGDGTAHALESKGVQLVSDTCWCMINRPLFPMDARHVVTNSGKYAHYGPGLSGSRVRLADLAECARAAMEGRSTPSIPSWLQADAPE